MPLLDNHCLGWGLFAQATKSCISSLWRSLSPFPLLPYFSPQHLTQSDMIFILLIYLFFVWLPRLYISRQEFVSVLFAAVFPVPGAMPSTPEALKIYLLNERMNFKIMVLKFSITYFLFNPKAVRYMKNPIHWYDGYIKNFIKILINYKIFLIYIPYL